MQQLLHQPGIRLSSIFARDATAWLLVLVAQHQKKQAPCIVTLQETILILPLRVHVKPLVPVSSMLNI